MADEGRQVNEAYEAPRLEVMGSLEEITQGPGGQGNDYIEEES